MQLRCTVHMGAAQRKLILVSQESETLDHLALKLAGFVLFFNLNALVEISSKNPAISSQEFKPDLLSLNDSGEIRLWVECGNVTTHKLDKLIRRNRNARIVVLKATPREAQNLRQALKKNEVNHSERVEIWAFPDGQFEGWKGVLEDSVEIIGETAERSFNLVANSVPFSFDFSTA